MITLAAEKRTVIGKAVKALRRKGFLPAVMYGRKEDSQSISVPVKDFGKVLQAAGESTLITLSLAGKEHNVLIHDVLLDPLTEKPLHADFLAVEMDKTLETEIPLEFIGESPAVKNEGGILIRVMHEVEVSALPKDLPHTIIVDVLRLARVGDRITLGDLKLSSGVTLIGDPGEVVALVESPRSEEELKALETAEPAMTAEVVTEREEKEVKKKAEEAETAEESA